MMDSAAKTRSPTADSSILCASAAAPAAHNNPARPAPPRLPPLPPPARARPRPRVTLSPPPPFLNMVLGGRPLKGPQQSGSGARLEKSAEPSELRSLSVH